MKDSIYHITGRLRDNLFSSILGTPGARSSSSVLAETSPYVRLMDPVRDAKRDSLRDPSWEPLRDIMRDPWRDPQRDFRREPLRDPLRDEFRDSLRETVRDPLRETVREPVRDPLRGPGRGPSRELGRDSASFLQPVVGISHNLNRQTVITQSMDHLGFSRNLDHSPSPRLWGSQVLSSSLLDVNVCLFPCWVIMFVHFVLVGLIADNTWSKSTGHIRSQWRIAFF